MSEPSVVKKQLTQLTHLTTPSILPHEKKKPRCSQLSQISQLKSDHIFFIMYNNCIYIEKFL